jgi:DNA-binding IclR family transcriptional regulator
MSTQAVREEATSSSGSPISVLGKAHEIFAAFDPSGAALGLADLARRSGVPKATAYRIAQELVSLNFLERVDDRYQIGWRMFELGQMVPGPAHLRDTARPALLDLHKSTNAVIHLAVRHGHDTLYLERLAGRQDARVLSAVGTRCPLWFTASGKLFLAFDDDLEATLAAFQGTDSEPRTRSSLRTVAQLRHELAATRERRWADERGECLDGYKSFAVPITGAGQDDVVAAISASLTNDRRDDQIVARALWAAGAEISRSLRRAGGRATAVPRAVGL